MDPAPFFCHLADREGAILAPYAMQSAQSLGRAFPEADHPYRGPFQRDRDRILHSASFRRLSGKMQVFTGDMGDYHRTRLTHTMEVASIARTIGRALGLNEDLIEALALMHDVGHPPFGHAGEDALDECLADEGGFSHNQFALTLVCELEVRCQAYPGLNLTREVLAGQQYRAAKATAAPQDAGAGTGDAGAGQPARTPLLEAQVVDAADSITYNAHDTDDAVMLGLVTLDELTDLPLVAALMDEIQDRQGPLPELTRRKALVHALIDRQVEDLLRATWPRLAAADFRSADQPARAGFRLAPSPGVQEGKTELERFLYQRVYRHPHLIQVRQQAQRRLRELFAALRAQPARLPPEFAARVASVGLSRAVGDYLASLTDRSCDQLYSQVFPIGWGDGPMGKGW